MTGAKKTGLGRMRSLRVCFLGLMALLVLLGGWLLRRNFLFPSNANLPSPAEELWQETRPRSRKEVLRLLERDVERHRLFLLLGQNIGTADSSEDPEDGYARLIRALQPRSVALMGVDYGWQFVPPADELRKVNQRLISHWQRGGLVSVSLHIGNPFTRGHTKELSSHDLRLLTQPGSEVHEAWMENLERTADALAQLQDAGVVVLWRPFHESNGGWFWWAHATGDPSGEAWTSAESFRRLWQHMHHYFTEVRGLDQLLWVYSAAATPNASGLTTDAYYPGDDWVDVVGIDAYTSNWTWENLNHRQAIDRLRAKGKPIVLSEAGPDHQQMDGSFDPMQILEFCANDMPDCGYVLFWHSWDRVYDGVPVSHQPALAQQVAPERLLSDPRVGSLEAITGEALLPSE